MPGEDDFYVIFVKLNKIHFRGGFRLIFFSSSQSIFLQKFLKSGVRGGEGSRVNVEFFQIFFREAIVNFSYFHIKSMILKLSLRNEKKLFKDLFSS